MRTTPAFRLSLSLIASAAGSLLALPSAAAPPAQQEPHKRPAVEMTTERGTPVAPVLTTLRQPSGRGFKARGWGDGATHGYETRRGYTLIRAKGGRWVYATGRTADGDLRAGKTSATAAPAATTPKHLRPADTADAGFEVPAAPSTSAGATATAVTTGRSLVILAEFTDVVGTTTPADWSAQFFGAGRSVRDFYQEASAGAFDLQPGAETSGTVNDGIVGWVSLPYAHPDPQGFSTQAQYDAARKIVKDAVTAADANVDWAAYDTNGNGYVEPFEVHVTVIVAGDETSLGGASVQCTSSVWAHRGGLDWPTPASDVSAPTLDGKVIGYTGYTEFGERHCNIGYNGPNGNIATIGVMSHELGHDMGWPDLYDTDQSSEGIGEWSLMASGSWNTDWSVPGAHLGNSPALPDAFSRAYQGWVSPTEVTVAGSPTTVTLGSASTSADVAQLLPNPNGIDWQWGSASGTGEYFLVENRAQTGYDAGLKGCGLLIWHIDEGVVSSNSANANESRPLVQLEQADGLDQLRTKANRSDAGDPFPGTSNNMLFDSGTNPDSRLHNGDRTRVQVEPVSTTCGATMQATVTADDNEAPTLTSPGDQTGTVGDVVSLQLEAADVDPDENFDFSATGLPAGLDIDGSTGLVSGTLASPNGASPYTSTFTVWDSHGATDTKTVTWTVDTSGPTCAAGEWRAEYFANRSLSGLPVAVACESAIDHEWGWGAPAGLGVGSDDFSVRWSQVVDLAAGTYQFTTTADDGARMLVDGSPVIDDWSNHVARTKLHSVALAEGVHTVVMEYYEASGYSVAQGSFGPATP